VATPTLEVRLNGERAGELLRRENGNLQFRYDDAYLEARRMPLSVNLPLRAEAYPNRDCLAFFGNLLPEEDVRAQVALATGISAANDYKLLERFGGDVAGAVTLLPVGGDESEPEPDELEPLSPERLDELLRGLPQRPLGIDEKGEVRMSLAGAQSKLPAIEVDGGFALPHGSARPTTHILKPEPERFPGLVANEFFCMRLAEEVGLNVAQALRGEVPARRRSRRARVDAADRRGVDGARPRPAAVLAGARLQRPDRQLRCPREELLAALRLPRAKPGAVLRGPGRSSPARLASPPASSSSACSRSFGGWPRRPPTSPKVSPTRIRWAKSSTPSGAKQSDSGSRRDWRNSRLRLAGGRTARRTSLRLGPSYRSGSTVEPFGPHRGRKVTQEYFQPGSPLGSSRGVARTVPATSGCAAGFAKVS
jgi:HipA-like protein